MDKSNTTLLYPMKSSSLIFTSSQYKSKNAYKIFWVLILVLSFLICKTWRLYWIIFPDSDSQNLKNKCDFQVPVIQPLTLCREILKFHPKWSHMPLGITSKSIFIFGQFLNLFLHELQLLSKAKTNHSWRHNQSEKTIKPSIFEELSPTI